MKAPDFAGASREVLSFLHQRVGMDLWMVGRADNDDWVVLAAEDHAYGVKEGDVFRWNDSFCSRMVREEGPRVAPRVAEVPAYAGLPFTRQVPIGAYVGVPLVDGDGRLFGTLCGLNRQPMPSSLVEEQAMVEVLADMLSGLLSAELHTTALARLTGNARVDALADPLTGLANRRGWELALAAEEERCRRYGASACVVAIELDGMKGPAAREVCDAVLVRAAQALRQTVRKPTPWPTSTTTASWCWASNAPPPRRWRCCAGSSSACSRPSCPRRWAWPCATAAAGCSTPSSARSTRWSNTATRAPAPEARASRARPRGIIARCIS